MSLVERNNWDRSDTTIYILFFFAGTTMYILITGNAGTRQSTITGGNAVPVVS